MGAAGHGGSAASSDHRLKKKKKWVCGSRQGPSTSFLYVCVMLSILLARLLLLEMPRENSVPTPGVSTLL